MAMVRAALAGSPFRSCPFTLSCLRHLTFSSSAVVISTEDLADKAGYTKHYGMGSWAPNQSVGCFLREQRQFLNDFLCHLKDQRVVLDSIREQLGLQKGDSVMAKAAINDSVSLPEEFNSYFNEYNTRKDVAMNAASNKLCTNGGNLVVEQPELSAVTESPSGNGVPIGLSQEESNSGGPIATNEAATNNFQHPCWPEWTTFLNHLRPYASNEKLKEGLELFEDTTILKRAIVKFAQAHEGTFGSLSRKNLLVLVQREFPSMDEKTAAGKKKLDAHLKEDGSRSLNNKVPRAKLTDVVRLLYRAVRSMPALGGSLPKDLNSAIIHILKVLNAASTAQHNNSRETLESFGAATSQQAEESNQTVGSVNVNADETCGDSRNARSA